MARVKVFVRGGAVIRSSNYWPITNVTINLEALIDQVKKWEVVPTDLGNITFSVLAKKAENAQPGDFTHYLQHSYQVADEASSWVPQQGASAPLPPAQETPLPDTNLVD